MPRPRKQRKPEAVILPLELDDDDEEAGSVIPDDDGWIALQQGGSDSGAGTGDDADHVVRGTPARRKRTPRRDS